MKCCWTLRHISFGRCVSSCLTRLSSALHGSYVWAFFSTIIWVAGSACRPRAHWICARRTRASHYGQATRLHSSIRTAGSMMPVLWCLMREMPLTAVPRSSPVHHLSAQRAKNGRGGLFCIITPPVHDVSCAPAQSPMRQARGSRKPCRAL